MYVLERVGSNSTIRRASSSVKASANRDTSSTGRRAFRIDRFRRDNLSFLRTFDWETRNPRSSRTAAMKADAPLDLGFVNCGFEIHE
jgi:hypothetical protein